MLLSIKTKLKLKESQKVLMAKHAGIARFTFNWGLATWQDLYKAGLKPNAYMIKKFYNNHVKPEYSWIKEKGICQKITQYAFDSLGNAYSRYFKGLAKEPKFKKKYKNDSFTIDASGKPLAVDGTSVKLPTIGRVKTYEGLPHTTCKKFTISRIADDWFIAFTYDREQIPEPKQHLVVGVDLGVKELATLSTNVVFPNPKHYRENLAKTQRLSRTLAKKKKGSANRFKARMKLAKHHAKVANKRKDTLHKLTNYLCKNHAVIVIEDLNVSGMMSNHKLACVIADCGFHEFKRQLLYKAEKFGNQIIISDRWFASSKTCSTCGCKKENLSLSERTFKCGHCQIEIDEVQAGSAVERRSTLHRDLNASINLEKLAKT